MSASSDMPIESIREKLKEGEPVDFFATAEGAGRDGPRKNSPDNSGEFAGGASSASRPGCYGTCSDPECDYSRAIFVGCYFVFLFWVLTQSFASVITSAESNFRFEPFIRDPDVSLGLRPNRERTARKSK